jgi:predicted RNase H-like nuclease
MHVVGVDGCSSGWIAVELTDGGPPQAHHLQRIDGVVTACGGAEVIGIDIPIGLPDASWRRADVEARKRLGPAGSSVFLTPPREVLTQTTHGLATARCVQLLGKGISRQSYGLAAKILEVERWLASAPCRVIEVHPEVAFRALLGRPAARKKTWAGMVQRRSALAAEGIVLDDVTGEATVKAAVDDMLDAAVVAWTARRVSAGTARSLPEPPEHNAAGEEMAIWF